MVSDFKGLGLGRGGLGLEWPGLGLVSVSDDEVSVSVSVSDDEAETPSLLAIYYYGALTLQQLAYCVYIITNIQSLLESGAPTT